MKLFPWEGQGENWKVNLICALAVAFILTLTKELVTIDNLLKVSKKKETFTH
ncbi:hypothetical protein ACJX0J_020378, partial [Zea mays]